MWTPDDWQIFLLCLLLAAHVINLARAIRSYMLGLQNGDPHGPSTLQNLEEIIKAHQNNSDSSRDNAVEELKHTFYERINALYLEMREAKGKIGEVHDAVKDLVSMERARLEIMTTIRRKIPDK